jgi:hypothetical protein
VSPRWGGVCVWGVGGARWRVDWCRAEGAPGLGVTCRHAIRLCARGVRPPTSLPLFLTTCAPGMVPPRRPECREGVQEAAREEQGYFIRSGIVVVLRNQTIPSGTVI